MRDTQNYVQLAAHGLTLWDVASTRVERDLEQWSALLALGRGGASDRYFGLTVYSRDARSPISFRP